MAGQQDCKRGDHRWLILSQPSHHDEELIGHHAEHVVLPQHRHHFETEEQQREAGSFGMWLFLLTEIMFFGGMFFSYLLYRNWYYDAFVTRLKHAGHRLGSAQYCAVLITSGFAMALGVYYAEVRNRKMLVLMLWLTTFFGVAFLGRQGDRVHGEVQRSSRSGRLLQREGVHQSPGRSEDGQADRESATAGHGAEDPDLLLPLLRHDRHARRPHDYRARDSVLADCSSERQASLVPGTSRPSRTSGSTGTSSILCGSSCSPCFI